MSKYGLEKDSIIEYWKNRSQKYGKNVVCGPKYMNSDEQKELYNNRFNFIFKRCGCPTDLLTLEYGCGIGWYSKCFNNYIGADITENFIKIARENNKSKDFIILNNCVLEDIKLPNFELFFTSTVLQHCSDNVVDCIFNNLSKIKDNPFVMYLYENSCTNCGHMNGRKTHEYKDIIEKHFIIDNVDSKTHDLERESTLSVFNIKGAKK